MLAAYHGRAPLVKLLLEHGANPNSLNDRGQSPLAGAVFKGEPEVVEVSLFLGWYARFSTPTNGLCRNYWRGELIQSMEPQAH
jgi:ankyrin repeat protein